MAEQLDHNFPSIIQCFLLAGEFEGAVPYGDGHINDTYVAHFREASGRGHRYILQRINQTVFKDPGGVMQNMERVTRHIQAKVLDAGGDPTRKTLTLIPAVDGNAYAVSPEGDYWRAFVFIPGAKTYLKASSLEHYYHAARTFGEFLDLLSDFPASQLRVTIPDFHHTPKRYQAFIHVMERDPVNRAHLVKPEIKFVVQRESETRVLVDLVGRRVIPERVTHNDTKIDNVMIDDVTGEGVCVIDLDTVMPGLAVFDFGDAVRSGANPAAEDEPDPSKVACDLVIFDRLAQGFLDATREMLTPAEISHLAFGARLITLEQGIRFLTDFLNGDVYYKIQRPDQNLDRTRTQLKLVADMEMKFDQMEATIQKYR